MFTGVHAYTSEVVRNEAGPDAKSCPRSNGGNGGGNGGNEANSTVVCERGFELMTIDAMLRSVAAPGTARDLKAADVNRNDHLCVQLAADGRSMTRFVDNNWAV